MEVAGRGQSAPDHGGMRMCGHFATRIRSDHGLSRPSGRAYDVRMARAARRWRPGTRVGGAILSLFIFASCADQEPTTPSPKGSSSSTIAEAEVTPLDPAADGTEKLPPGRYRLAANGDPDAADAVVRLPAGFSSFGGFAVGVFEFGAGEPFHTLAYWTVSGVYVNPCTKKGGLLDPGDSVDDLASALSAQHLTTSTPPTPIVIDGYQGVQFDLFAPDDVVFEDCVEGYFDIWDSSPGGGRYLQLPGQVLRIRVLNVDGARVVVETSAVPDKDQGGLAAVDMIAEAITFAH